ncbi:MAG: phenylacetate-CoA oxygenase subunit PaaC [Actinomycetota bacterium]|nr:phenylacetate-CoA oxygenase subunit PaaC [Actinomycetota bacterium]
MSDALLPLVLSLADDELVLGHRHSEWTGFAPHIEEDVAFSSIAQDEIGHATALYQLIGELTGDDPDHLALGREPTEYRNATICERPNGDWAFTLARHWLYDHADDVRLECLESSSNSQLAALAHKIRREERYHLIHAETWVKRVAHGPVEGRTKLIDAMACAFPEIGGVFEEIDGEDKAVHQGELPTPTAELHRIFLNRAVAALDALGLPTEIHSRADEHAEFVASSSGDLIAEPGAARDQLADRSSAGSGGRGGKHTDDFKELWDTMTGQYRAHPGATW